MTIAYERRRLDPETGLPEDQAFEVTCSYAYPDGRVCGGRWRGTRSSGRVREKALLFANQHRHEHPFDKR